MPAKGGLSKARRKARRVNMESLIFSHNHQSTKKGYVSIDAMFQDQLPVFLHGDADPYYLAHFSISLQIATSSLFKIHYPLRGLIYTNFHHAIAHLTIDRCLVTDCNLSSLIHHPSFHPLPSLTPPPNAKQSHNSESPPNNIATHLPTPLSSHPSTLPYQPNLPSTMPPTPLPAHFLRIAKAGSGASGGIFSPSLFMGATLGAAFGQLVTLVWPVPGVNSVDCAMIGMAAMVGGGTGAVSTSPRPDGCWPTGPGGCSPRPRRRRRRSRARGRGGPGG